jgi:cytoskeleton protein RodZ
MGAYLRAARRRRRLSIERAAEDTRIRADFLMRMESDEFDFLAPAYVRGFLRSYARYLRVDPDPLTVEFDRRYGIQRVDPAQLMALQRRMKHRAPRDRIQLSRWAVAAMLVAGSLAVLAVVGLLSGPSNDSDDEGGRVAVGNSPTVTASSSPELTASPSPTAGEAVDDAIAFTEGIELEIVASEPCWTRVSVDGSPTPVFADTMEAGESQVFSAEDEMTLVLGFPEGVELIVNGQNLGAPGGPNPITVTLPDDIESLT